MKRLFFLLLALPLRSVAQEKIYIQGTAPDLYLNYAVQPKDGWYKIARLYNINAKKLAEYNGTSVDKGLSAGQAIRVPLTADNFTQADKDKAQTGETLVPVYHIIQEKEGLYRVSVEYNKVPIASLKKWNNLQGENLDKGADFIVGYLRVKKEQAELIAKATAATDAVSSVATNEEATEAAAETEAPEQQPAVVAPVELAKPVAAPDKPVRSSASATSQPDMKSAILGEGVFKTDYEQQTEKKKIEKEEGTGADFKSTSGWSEPRYYCLYNNMPSGSIVKVTNTVNGKSIYAKVVAPMPDISQNEELSIRISNAAAKALGLAEDARFNCTIEYAK